jgi:prevent-host-death family protein
MSETDRPARVGVRELRQNLSVYLDRVKAGETLEVTEHGTPVARLGPNAPARMSIVDQMIADGRITPARTDHRTTPPSATDSRATAQRDPPGDARRGRPMTELAYLDASALVRLVVEEAESVALNRWYVEARRLVTSRIGIVETMRASSRRSCDPTHRVRIMSDVEVIELNSLLAGVAATLDPPALRTLDAIHLAAAMALMPHLDAFVTYDDRLADAARAIGLPVVRPA